MRPFEGARDRARIGHVFGEVRAANEFADDENQVSHFAHFIDVDDVGMLQGAGGAEVLRFDHHFGKALAHFVHAGGEGDLAILDEHQVIHSARKAVGEHGEMICPGHNPDILVLQQLPGSAE